MVVDWDCIVRKLVRVADGRVKPGHDVGASLSPAMTWGRESVFSAPGITSVQVVQLGLDRPSQRVIRSSRQALREVFSRQHPVLSDPSAAGFVWFGDVEVSLGASCAVVAVGEG